MTRKQHIKEIFNLLKDGEYLCVLTELNTQGLSMSCDWTGNWRDSLIRYRDYGGWASNATIAELTRNLESVRDLSKIVTADEFEDITGEEFFYWGL